MDEQILTNEEIKKLKFNKRILKRYHERMNTEPNYAEKMRAKANERYLRRKALAKNNGVEPKKPEKRGRKIKFITVAVVQKIETI
jgi:hypothetical protein